jgi:hypothetical protein
MGKKHRVAQRGTGSRACSRATVRCERRTEWLIGGAAEVAYAYLCGMHLDFVRQLGQPATPIK